MASLRSSSDMPGRSGTGVSAAVGLFSMGIGMVMVLYLSRSRSPDPAGITPSRLRLISRHASSSRTRLAGEMPVFHRRIPARSSGNRSVIRHGRDRANPPRGTSNSGEGCVKDDRDMLVGVREESGDGSVTRHPRHAGRRVHVPGIRSLRRHGATEKAAWLVIPGRSHTLRFIA